MHACGFGDSVEIHGRFAQVLNYVLVLIVIKEGNSLKLNILGVTSAVLAFVSLALPWWEVSYGGLPSSTFLWGWRVWDGNFMFNSRTLTPYVALGLIVVSGVLSMVASIRTTEKEKILLGLAGIFSMLSVIVFAARMYDILSELPPSYLRAPGTSLSDYPSFGLWLSLIATVITLVAYARAHAYVLRSRCGSVT